MSVLELAQWWTETVTTVLSRAMSALFVFGIVAVVVRQTWWEARQRAARKADLQRAYGLEGPDADRVAELPDGTLRVREAQRNKETWTTVEVETGRVPLDLVVVTRSTARPASDRGTGDRAFDARYRVDGAPTSLGLLDATTRAELLATNAQVRDGVVSTGWRTPPTVPQVDRQRALALRLAERGPVEVLEAVVTGAFARELRRRSLVELHHLAPDRAAPHAAALLDGDHPVGTALAALLAGDGPAFAAAAEGCTPDQLLALLDALGPATPPAFLVALTRAVVHGDPSFPVWRRLCEVAATAPPAVEVARAVGEGAAPVTAALAVPHVADRALGVVCRVRDPSLEPLVLALLPSAASALPAAHAWLRSIGTVAAVEAVEAMVSATWLGTEARADAVRTRDVLRARLDRFRGGLAIADDAGGALSEAAPDLRGAVSERRGREGA